MPDPVKKTIEHIVHEGDRLSSIAFHEGVDPKAVWNDPKNAALKKKREDGEILMPGDKVSVTKIAGPLDAKPDAETAFEAASVLSELKLHLLVAGQPLAGKTIFLTITQTLPPSKSAPVLAPLVTKADGSLTFHLDPRVTECILWCLEPAFSATLLVGYLHPVDEGAGVEQRLNNLGYYCPLPPPSPGKQQQEAQARAREAALRRFQFDIGAPVTGVGSQEALRKHTHEPPSPPKPKK
jgi:hypothetical protein